MQFSNVSPARVDKLEDYKVKRIAIKDGKFMAFLVDGVESPAPEDSEVDPEEEKDIVAGSLGRKAVRDSVASSVASRASSSSFPILDRKLVKAEREASFKY
jgi:hypothetical protein